MTLSRADDRSTAVQWYYLVEKKTLDKIMDRNTYSREKEVKGSFQHRVHIIV
jgi:hypothetical protein